MSTLTGVSSDILVQAASKTLTRVAVPRGNKEQTTASGGGSAKVVRAAARFLRQGRQLCVAGR